MTCTKSTSLFEREYAAAQQEAASRHITLFSREGMQCCGTLMCCTTVGVCIAFWPWQVHLAVVQLRRGPHASDGREQVCGYVPPLHALHHAFLSGGLSFKHTMSTTTLFKAANTFGSFLHVSGRVHQLATVCPHRLFCLHSSLMKLFTLSGRVLN